MAKEVIIERIKDGKRYTPDEYALQVYKEGKHIIYCDIEGVFQDLEDKDSYILADQCGNHVYIDQKEYKVVVSEKRCLCGDSTTNKDGVCETCGFIDAFGGKNELDM